MNRSLPPILLVTVLLAAALLVPAKVSAHAPAASPAETLRPGDIEIQIQHRISLRDGVELAATIWRPALAEPVPTILVLTPYISDETHNRAMRFARHGYAYVSVDRRGRGNSEGLFRPLFGNGPDGADIIAWITQQTWSDGRVATRGGSYRGMVQWQIMAEHPPGLAATVPTAAVYPGHDFPNADGTFYSYTAQWLSLTAGRTGNDALFGDFPYWLEHFHTMHTSHQPFHKLSRLAGPNAPQFLEWLDHPEYDAYWSEHNPTADEYAGMDLPILTITGYFDGDQPGALRYHREHLRHASDEARTRHILLIGPWDHGGTRYPSASLGGLTFDETSVLDLDGLHLAFFDWILRGAARPPILRDSVNYYVMGAEEWRHAASLESLADGSLEFYLSSSDRVPNDVFHSGVLQRAPATDQPVRTLRHDPLNPAADFGLEPPDGFLTHTRNAHLPNSFIYHSAPLDQAATLIGTMELDLHLALDVPDADLIAIVGAVLPDGSFLSLGRDIVRGRYRQGREKAIFITPGKVERWRFDGFYFTGRELPAGSRLRLIVAPFDSQNYQKNYQSGGRIGYETAQDARTATIHIYHDAEHRSVLRLPIQRQREAINAAGNPAK